MDKFLKRKGDGDKNDSITSFKKTKVHRLYSDDYIKFGFHWTGDTQNPSPLCVVCGQTLSNVAMVPSKMKRHLTTKHPNLQTKNVDYFQRLLESNARQSQLFEKTVTVSEKAQLASYEVAEIIALKSKSHVLAESVILPACKKMVKIMLGDKAEQEIIKIPLSNNTIQRRILDLSDNIEESVISKFQNSLFALQIDESTDISNHAQLIAFIRVIDEDAIINQFLCCKELPTTTKGQDIFDTITACLEKYGLSWNLCVGICTDGAPSMVGSVKGFTSLVEKQNPNIVRTHCFLHREVLVSKITQNELKEVLNQVIEMVNFIKTRPLKSRIFELLCKDMDSHYVRLLLHTEVRWLSKGKVLSRVIELQKELLIFFENEKLDKFCNHLKNELWMSKIEYLNEIFGHLNSLNSNMQGRNENILTATDKLVTFKKKIGIWKNRMKKEDLDMFPSVRKTCVTEMILIISEHLTCLENKIEEYFPSISIEEFDWIRDPFLDLSAINLSNFELSEEEELASLSSDRGLKLKYAQLPLDAFWISVMEEYPTLSKKAIKVLLQFSTSYLCELGFSYLNNIKNKKRERLKSTEEELRVCLSHIRPQIAAVVKKHQAQLSH